MSTPQSTDFPATLLPALEDAAREAGRAVMEVYDGPITVTTKADSSPVTEADARAEAIIVPVLRRLTPHIPVVAEEAMAAGDRQDISEGTFWLVDPLDGTKEFIARNGQFTVNIGLILKGRPALGVVLAPAQNRLWSGCAGHGATVVEADGSRKAIHCRKVPARGAVVVASRSHGNAGPLETWLASLDAPELLQAGSSLKFCLVATGEADFYPRFGPTCEWDVAAAHGVLVAAGGEVYDWQGKVLGYGKPNFLNPHFLARSTID